jgi:hypothetical protein
MTKRDSMNCHHFAFNWEMISYRLETKYSRFEPMQSAYTYERCLGCLTRRLTAEGQPTYLISDDGIEAA